MSSPVKALEPLEPMEAISEVLGQKGHQFADELSGKRLKDEEWLREMSVRLTACVDALVDAFEAQLKHSYADETQVDTRVKRVDHLLDDISGIKDHFDALRERLQSCPHLKDDSSEEPTTQWHKRTVSPMSWSRRRCLYF